MNEQSHKKIRKVSNSYQVSRHFASDADARGVCLNVYRTLKEAKKFHPNAGYHKSIATFSLRCK